MTKKNYKKRKKTTTKARWSFARKSNKSQTSKTEDSRGLRLLNVFAKLQIQKWLLTQTMSLLLHQTKLLFKGNLSYISLITSANSFTGIHIICSILSARLFPSASQCIFPPLNFTPHNIFTPTYRCNWHWHFYLFIFMRDCAFPSKKLFRNSYSAQLTP